MAALATSIRPSTEAIPVPEGLFTAAGLVGGQCGACGRRHFPLAPICPWCGHDAVSQVALSTEGTLWAWTAVTAPPPGYHGDVPFGVGIVELPEGVRVITRLTESDPGALSEGQPMELCIVPLHRAEDGSDVVTYAFAPV